MCLRRESDSLCTMTRRRRTPFDVNVGGRCFTLNGTRLDTMQDVSWLSPTRKYTNTLTQRDVNTGRVVGPKRHDTDAQLPST